jgi:hypothetical protein
VQSWKRDGVGKIAQVRRCVCGRIRRENDINTHVDKHKTSVKKGKRKKG